MKLELAFLCDFAEITNRNLFNAYGGGIRRIRFKRLPDTQDITLLLSIGYIPIEESGDHKVEVRLIDGNGKDRMEPEIRDTEFSKDQRSYDAVFDLKPRFEKYEEHSVEIMVDGRCFTSMSLDIIPERKPEEKPVVKVLNKDIQGNIVSCAYCKETLKKTDATKIDLVFVGKRSKQIVRNIKYFHPTHYNAMMGEISGDLQKIRKARLQFEAEKYKIFGTYLTKQDRERFALGEMTFNTLLMSLNMGLEDALYGEASVRIKIKPGKGYKLYNKWMLRKEMYAKLFEGPQGQKRKRKWFKK